VQKTKVTGKKCGNAPGKGFSAEIHSRFPWVMGWFPAEYAWNCHFLWSATFGCVFHAAEYLCGILIFLGEEKT
jgi:hypothetical protein